MMSKLKIWKINLMNEEDEPTKESFFDFLFEAENFLDDKSKKKVGEVF
jgi:hypothetical protein